MNADSAKSFGYDGNDALDILAPNSIATNGRHCFVTDQYFNRIKRVSFKTGELISSGQLPDTLARVNDCVIVGDQILATTSNGHVVFFDYNLKSLKAYKVSRAFGEVVGADKESAIVYFPSDDLKTITIDRWGNILKMVNERQEVSNSVHGRYLLKTRDSIETEFHRVSRKGIYYSPLPYGGGNLDYTQDYIVHYSITDSSFHLKVCSVKSEADID